MKIKENRFFLVTRRVSVCVCVCLFVRIVNSCGCRSRQGGNIIRIRGKPICKYAIFYTIRNIIHHNRSRRVDWLVCCIVLFPCFINFLLFRHIFGFEKNRSSLVVIPNRISHKMIKSITLPLFPATYIK